MPLPPLPNHLPPLAAAAPYRLAVLLPWPSEDDCRIGKPLTGSAGNWLRNALSAVGIKLDAEVAICHLSQSYLGTWEQGGGWEGEAVQGGIAALAADLSLWRPNLVLGLDDPRLGAGVLHLLRHGNVAPHRTPSGYQWPSKLGKWRGSLFHAKPFMPLNTAPAGAGLAGEATPVAGGTNFGNAGQCNQSRAQGESAINPARACARESGFAGGSPAVPTNLPPDCGDSTNEMRTLTSAHALGQAALSFKSLATYHPTYLLSVWSKAFETRQDIRRARDESRTPNLSLPPTNVTYGPVE